MLTFFLIAFSLIAFFTWVDLVFSQQKHEDQNLAESVVVVFAMLFIVVLIVLNLIQKGM